MSVNSTGYGPPTRNLLFDGDESSFELWEVKFLAYLRLQKLHSTVIDSTGNLIETPATADTAEKNSEVFACLVHFLDDKSLNLIIRDAKDNGRKALKILRDHYLGSSKPRVISMYCELTSLKLASSESVTEYMLRAETTVARLKDAKEQVSDALLIAMLMKGLPDSYQSFSTVMMQQDMDTMTFEKFKVALKNFAENEKARSEHQDTDANVMKVNHRTKGEKEGTKSSGVTCYTCHQTGHKRYQCPQRLKKWCDTCNTGTHYSRDCRKRKNMTVTKTVQNQESCESDPSYMFNVCETQDYLNKASECESYLVDCGATSHIISDRSLFTKFDDNFKPEDHTIVLADSSQNKGIVSARGDAQIKLTSTEGKKCNVTLKDALYIPSFQQNIISVQSMTKRGASVKFGPDSSEITVPDGTQFDINQSGKLFYVNTVKSSAPIARSLKECHMILGHSNVDDIMKLEKVVNGMKISDKTKFKCGTCVEGKMCQFRNHSADEKAKKPLDLVHTDLAGPIAQVSNEESKYAIVFVDDYSGMLFIYFLKNKSDAPRATERFIADLAPYGTIKRLRSDCGTEYTCKEFQDIMVKNKIHHEFSSVYSAHQNGTAERSWRTIFDMTRCVLNTANLPKSLWNHAARTSVYIRNRCYSERLNATPYEVFTGRKPNLNNMHIFGSTCYMYVQDKKKLDNRAEKCRFIGYDYCSPSYIVYFPGKHQIKKARCVEFFDNYPDEEEERMLLRSSEDKNLSPSNDESCHQKNPTEENSTQEERRYPTRDRKPPAYLKDYVTGTEAREEDSDAANSSIDYFYLISDIPLTYSEAVQSSDADKWQKAMEEEVTSLIANDTYEVVPHSTQPVIGGRWVFNKKCNGNEVIYKARFVAKGFSQVPGVDYKETFSPTARFTSIRVILNLAMKENFVVHQMDVKSAYLNAKIDCDIYMEEPKGFESKSNGNERKVLKLKKSLYGLKQSGRMWNNLLHSFLVGQGFVRSDVDNCVYTRSNNSSKTIILIWVDDLIISGSDLAAVEEVKVALSNKFRMKDFGQISEFLGIQFDFSDDGVKLHQSNYVERILSKFQMSDCNPKFVPCDASAAKIDFVDAQPFEDNRLYREIVGSLIYLSSCTRPDLAFVLTKLSQCLENPTEAHFKLCKFVLKYLKGSKSKGLIYYRGKGIDLIAYSDSDWGSSSDRKSISGYCFKLNKADSFVSWRTKRQNVVALSTCEAEYISVTHALQEGLFLRQLLNDLLSCSKSIVLHVDNRGTIDLAHNPVHNQRTKHVDIRYHFIRQCVQEGIVSLVHVSSNDNFADVFTKPATKPNMSKFFIN